VVTVKCLLKNMVFWSPWRPFWLKYALTSLWWSNFGLFFICCSFSHVLHKKSKIAFLATFWGLLGILTRLIIQRRYGRATRKDKYILVTVSRIKIKNCAWSTQKCTFMELYVIVYEFLWSKNYSYHETKCSYGLT
jgi:hypothetical protein